MTNSKSKGKDDAGFGETRAGFRLDALSAPDGPAPGRVTLALTGSWTTASLHSIENKLTRALGDEPVAAIDLSGLDRLDTAGALAVRELALGLDRSGNPPEIIGADPHQQKLLQAAALPEEEERPPPRPPALLVFVSATGRNVLTQLETIKEIVGFFGRFLVTLGRLLIHPGQIRWTSLTAQIEHTGLRAIPIVGLLTFLIGVVVAYMGSDVLAQFGAQVFAVKLLEVTVLREMGVLITAIVVAGRSSSAFTAQIGSMKSNQEIAALQSMGLDPVALLVVPRIMALVITLPLLVFLANLAALTGGALALWFSMNLGFSSFWLRFHESVKVGNFLVGMVKTPFFGLGIGIIGCYQGFKATGTAESVGFLTTVSVVQSIFVVILLDALFALFFTTIGV